MALIHRATLEPSKRELIDAWLPSRSWYDVAREGSVAGGPSAAYRLDDPAGEVGLESFLLGSSAGDGVVLHVPLTFRGAPLEGAEGHLIGTCEHSVLGTRWVYDGCGDPVWVATLATTILTGSTQAEELVDEGRGDDPVPREPGATAVGSGSGSAPVEPGSVDVRDEGDLTVVTCEGLEVVVSRIVGTEVNAAQVLTARCPFLADLVVAGVR